MRFAPEYVTCVLTDNFEDAKDHLQAPLMAGAPISLLPGRGRFNRGARSSNQTARTALSVGEIRKRLGVREVA